MKLIDVPMYLHIKKMNEKELCLLYHPPSIVDCSIVQIRQLIIAIPSTIRSHSLHHPNDIIITASLREVSNSNFYHYQIVADNTGAMWSYLYDTQQWTHPPNKQEDITQSVPNITQQQNSKKHNIKQSTITPKPVEDMSIPHSLYRNRLIVPRKALSKQQTTLPHPPAYPNNKQPFPIRRRSIVAGDLSYYLKEHSYIRDSKSTSPVKAFSTLQNYINRRYCLT